VNKITFYLYIFIAMSISGCSYKITDTPWIWEKIDAKGAPVARHEAGFIAVNKKLYLMGGRRINPTSIFDTETQEWTNAAPTPIELHHFQPVIYEDKIYIVGALTGQWPNEKPIDHIVIYDPKTDTYTKGHNIPKHRQRGGSGVVVYNNKMYIVGGIVNGHMDGYVPWFDEYNPKTGQWTQLPDAPIARDHFQAAILKDKLYAFSGRKTSKRTDQDMALTVKHGNIFNFKSSQWEPVTSQYKVPTLRAGSAVFTWADHLIIGGGESISQIPAHKEIEAFNTQLKKWYQWPKLLQGRHGTGFAVVDGYVYTASGTGKRGGEPELLSIERLKLPTQSVLQNLSALPENNKPLPITKQWHTLTLNFNGPNTSELNPINPFLQYKLLVTFTHQATNKKITVPGYFAADGNAAETSSTSGNIWQVKFNPEDLGQWSYQATLYKGKDIAITQQYQTAEKAPLKHASGQFVVIPTDRHDTSFFAQGRLIADNGYFVFKHNKKPWFKGGTNSPENILGYEDFDNTYRIPAESRDGEAAPSEALHNFNAHLKDWREGDPQWQKNKGRSIIGSMNYLAEQGMNSAYFLTLNILGDGKDVWPYISPEDFTRFDVSKLAQWEILFEHMQNKGILLHLVIQETENELMLDNGDTGPLRQLYFNELIARFGHHLGLVWNLGEENGYAKWTPNAQNTQQRKAMASYLKQNDVFNHPVLLHTHSHDPDRENILTPLLGFKDIDGLSLQQDKREKVPAVIKRWRRESIESGHHWLITMDEIGMWHTAALPDSVDSKHDTLRRYALWGSILSGGAGVEWYFGAKHPHNDLTSEDWRQREKLWQLTNVAQQFFTQFTPFGEMTPCDQYTPKRSDIYCAQRSDDMYVLFFSEQAEPYMNRPNSDNTATIYNVHWFDPINGGELKTGNVKQVTFSQQNKVNIGKPQGDKNQDWVIVLKKAI